MDFDLGNIFYIIVTIIAIVAGLAGKKKKKPAGNPVAAPHSERNPLNFLEQLGLNIDESEPVMAPEKEEVVSQDFSDEAEETEGMESYDDEPVVKESVKSVYSNYEGVFNPEAEANRLLMEKEAESVTYVSLLEEDDEVEQVINIEEIIKKFDITSAVIYSEILQRKAY